ncbi:MAG: hypothetical protein H7222_13775 [Methylotenera sp.]|nr:hypothetical protein [Oligoflexia bacterium]
MSNFRITLKSNAWSVTSILSAALSASVLSGCISLTGTSEVLSQGKNKDGTEVAASQINHSPIVEAYLNYEAAPSKWVGPAAFVVHVQAKDSVQAEFSVRHGMHSYVAPEVKKSTQKVIHRSLASEGGGHHHEVAAKASKTATKKEMPAVDETGESVSSYGLSLSTEVLRERLHTLAELVADEDQNPEVKGCLSPLKVRLVRSDGSVLEKEGCRNALGWPGYVSQMVSALISARTDLPTPGAAAAAPAVVPATASAGTHEAAKVVNAISHAAQEVFKEAAVSQAVAKETVSHEAVVKEAVHEKASRSLASASETKPTLAAEHKAAPTSERKADQELLKEMNRDDAKTEHPATAPASH